MALNLSAFTGTQTPTAGSSTGSLKVLSAPVGPQPTISVPTLAPATPSPVIQPKPADLRIVDTGNSNSTIKWTPPTPAQDIPVRAVFGTKDQQINIKPLPVPGLQQAAALLANLVNRTIELPFKVGAQLQQNVAATKSNLAGKLETPATTALGMNPERLGFDGSVLSTGERANRAYEQAIANNEQAPKWLQAVAPSFKDPVGWAAFKATIATVAPDVADVLVSGDIASDVVKKALIKTAPDVEQLTAWNQLGRPATLDEATARWKTIQQEFHPDKLGGDIKISSAANDAISVLKAKGIPSQGVEAQLHKVLSVLNSDLGDLATGKITPVGAVSQVGIKQLPGTAEEPGLPMGLSTKKVKNVGGVPEDVTTQILNQLKGRDFVSKQFIEDLTNQGSIRQPEKELIRKLLADEGDNVDVNKFTQRVQTELLPLESRNTYNNKIANRNGIKQQGDNIAQYEGITLPEDIRGPVADYFERIYQSPIKTSAGDIHFSALGGNKNEISNYFAHTRIEDLPTTQKEADLFANQQRPAGTNFVKAGTFKPPKEATRRVIELQSDLFQKGRLEGETKLSEYAQGIADKSPEAAKSFEAQRASELSKLEPYRNTWHERIIREEIKQAAKDGKTKLQFPTGETAMKIEGLGDTTRWVLTNKDGEFTRNVRLGDLKVGKVINEATVDAGVSEDQWVITDVLGDGKFKAVPKDRWDVTKGFDNETLVDDGTRKKKWVDFSSGEKKDYINQARRIESNNYGETFDISGKVDTSNPIYKFYEKDVQKFLQKFGGKKVVDPQGVSWIEVPVSKNVAGESVVAFGKSESLPGEYDLAIAEAKKELAKIFTPQEMKFTLNNDLLSEGKVGQFSLRRSPFSDKIQPLIELVEKGGKVSSDSLYHEAFHGYFNTFVPEAERFAILSKVKRNYLTAPARALLPSNLYPTADARAEDWLAQDFARFVAGKQSASEFKNFYQKLLDMLRNWIRKITGAQKVYDDILNQVRPTESVPMQEGVFRGKTAPPGDIPPERPASAEEAVINKTPEFKSIPAELKDKIRTFFRPSRNQQSRAFGLLGNKDTTVPLFRDIFAKWVKGTVDTIIEPYAGAFTIGTHSLDEAIKGGLKRFYSNIFDKEKFLIVKAIQDGKLPEVKKLVEDSARTLSQTIYENAKGQPEVRAVLDKFFKAYPDSYIGSDQFAAFIRQEPIGSRVTVYQDDYDKWRIPFQEAYNKLHGKEPSTIEEAVMNAFIDRTGVFGGKGQPLINSQGFTSFQQKVFGKFGMVSGFDDIAKTFKLAQEHGTDIKIFNEDGAAFLKKNNAEALKLDPQSVGYYLDPPYIKSATTYENVKELDNFRSGKALADSHKVAFNDAAKGAELMLTNDVDAEYLAEMQKRIKNPGLFAYKEGNTPTSLVTTSQTKPLVDSYLDAAPETKTGKQDNAEIARLKAVQIEKNLSSATFSRVRKALGISELKNASPEELDVFLGFLEGLQDGDKMLTDLQIESLKDIVKPSDFGGKPLTLLTQREVIEKYREAAEVMAGKLTKFVENTLFPSVDIKEGHPLVTKVVNKADELMSVAEKETERRNQAFDVMLKKAEKSRAELLPTGEAAKRKLVPQNKEIFQALGGFDVKLTKEEAAVVAYLRNFFSMVRNDLQLEKWRRFYVTHLEKPLLEKIASDGIIPAVADIFKLKSSKDLNLPIDIMLELDNLIGSNKFFKFSLPRSGYGNPTTNLRRILNDYGRLYEAKKALDEILPEGQAVTQLLLQPKTAVWMKRYLQNLKGRGLDTNFRTGKMSWLVRVADNIVDIGYIQLLSLNVWSALKNIAAGEANSFIYQDLRKYLLGKSRMLQAPLKLGKMANQAGILEGTFADYAQKGIGKLKKLQDFAMIGQQAGEYGIRGSLFASELTPQEWASGKITPERVRAIKDVIAITQGIFSKTDSPLWVQTWYGRLIMQMNRWRITNAMMVRRIAVDAAKEVKAGAPGVATRRLSKAFIIYGVGMYLAYEAAKAGNKRMQQVAESMAGTINSIVEDVTMKPIVDMLANNPTYSALKQIAFSIQELAAYIGVPGVEAPKAVQFQSGIENTNLPGVNQLGDIFGGSGAGVKIPSVSVPSVKIPSVKIPSIKL